MIPGALPLLLVGGISSIFLAGPLPRIVGGLAAFPVFVIVVITPFLAVGRLVEEHRSSLWTLACRQLQYVEVVKLKPGVKVATA